MAIINREDAHRPTWWWGFLTQVILLKWFQLRQVSTNLCPSLRNAWCLSEKMSKPGVLTLLLYLILFFYDRRAAKTTSMSGRFVLFTDTEEPVHHGREDTAVHLSSMPSLARRRFGMLALSWLSLLSAFATVRPPACGWYTQRVGRDWPERRNRRTTKVWPQEQENSPPDIQCMGVPIMSTESLPSPMSPKQFPGPSQGLLV